MRKTRLQCPGSEDCTTHLKKLPMMEKGIRGLAWHKMACFVKKLLFGSNPPMLFAAFKQSRYIDCVSNLCRYSAKKFRWIGPNSCFFPRWRKLGNFVECLGAAQVYFVTGGPTKSFSCQLDTCGRCYKINLDLLLPVQAYLRHNPRLYSSN